ncbi:MAG TPA: GNAT family N-acetyltransferase [Anaerolineales bacterium]|nr:GNAT family N-acetyltransferase [Anaerolineales bacterium]
MRTENILTNPSEAELESAVQENLYALFRSMQVIPGCELMESDSLGLHHASLSNPMFRGAWKTRFSPEDAETRIDEVSHWFKQRKAPYFFWWTDAQTRLVDLVERLMRRGFDGNLEGDPGMVVNLHKLEEDVQPPDGFNIIQARDQKSLADCRDVFAEAFEATISNGQAWADATLAIKPENVPWQLYVRYLDRQPVATSALFNGAGVAGIYGVGTIPRERNRGIGAAMTLKPLLEARKQGYHFAVLFSSRMGYPVYKRLGFREVASKIGMYIMEWD